MSQADQNISNDTGSNVRADINSNLSALYSNNSGAAAPSTTTAFMWWADTSNDALKIRNAADDGFVTVGTLSATNLGLATLASPTLPAMLVFLQVAQAHQRFVDQTTPTLGCISVQAIRSMSALAVRIVFRLTLTASRFKTGKQFVFGIPATATLLQFALQTTQQATSR